MKLFTIILVVLLTFGAGFLLGSSPDNVHKFELKSYRDTMIFGDTVMFQCVRCGQLNEQYVWMKVQVPYCK